MFHALTSQEINAFPRLNFSRNIITNLGPFLDLLRKCKNLRELDLSHNPLQEREIDNLLAIAK